MGLERLAIFASTLGHAVALANAPRDEHTTEAARSVAGDALSFASAEVLEQLEAELRSRGELGVGPTQFPAYPWVLWDHDRIFSILKSSELATAAEQLRGVSLEEFIRDAPALFLAALGGPHTRVRLPRWAYGVGAGLVGVGVALGLRALRERAWRT